MERADIVARDALNEMNRLLDGLFALPMLLAWPVPDRTSWDPVVYVFWRAACAELGHEPVGFRSLPGRVEYSGNDTGYVIVLGPALREFRELWEGEAYPHLIFRKPVKSARQRAAIAHAQRARKQAAPKPAPAAASEPEPPPAASPLF